MIIPKFNASFPNLFRVRHIALRLCDFASWPTPQTASHYLTQPTRPNDCPWFKQGFLDLLRGAYLLRTLDIVVDCLFTSPRGYEQDIQQGVDPHLVSSSAQLRDLVASFPRNEYGFSDYDVFIARTKMRMHFFPSCRPPNRYKRAIRCSAGFKEYDPFFQKVLSLVRAYTSPPLRKQRKQGRSIETRLVVDLDSSLNGLGVIGLLRERKVNKSSHGYERYFARSSAVDWYTDVSGNKQRVEEFNVKESYAS
ncbi:hypothetical protein PG993_012527 [Apiospora rasikravindrae]|uniref:Uncharacterized protein n=1 Tax=Apiospora rasikravindrae TaxID=990691 RepID=A0ABR1S2L2_9PEZI